MSGPGTLAEKGEEMSRFVAKLRAAKRQQKDTATKPAFRAKGNRLPDAWLLDPCNVWCDGYWHYMHDREQRVLDGARQQIAEERSYWRQHFMQMMEFHLEHETNPDLVAGLKRELHKVRRALNPIKPAPETIRAQTRERVRRYREKKRAEKSRASRK